MERKTKLKTAIKVSPSHSTHLDPEIVNLERERERDPNLSSSLVIGDLDISSITDKGDIGIHTGECTAHAL